MKELIEQLKLEREKLVKLSEDYKSISADVQMLSDRLAELRIERESTIKRVYDLMDELARSLKPTPDNVIHLSSRRQ